MYINFKCTEPKVVSFDDNHEIRAWEESWEDFDDNGKLKSFKLIKSQIYRNGMFVLNVGECANGDKFNGINHAINQAKTHIAICKLYNLGEYNLVD